MKTTIQSLTGDKIDIYKNPEGMSSLNQSVSSDWFKRKTLCALCAPAVKIYFTLFTLCPLCSAPFDTGLCKLFPYCIENISLKKESNFP